jgi:type II secretory pathway component GspD/PulD (secretin)
VSYQSGERIGIPIRATRKASTKVNVRDGKTIVIGGLTSNRKTRTVYKIPILGSIPLLGQLFRMNNDSVAKVDLMIFVTPRIVSSGKIEEYSSQNKQRLEPQENKK